jgi:CRISPR/Cas system CSM-associated protein Csm3 (group 7 of RAMP superfamily)
MSLPRYERFIAVARVVVEAATPLSVTRGEAERGFDTMLVTDANGLPAIPGTAIAGMLRHLYVDEYEAPRTDEHAPATPAADALFGYVAGRAQQASRVEVSWAAIHDAFGRPIDELLLGDAIDERLPLRTPYAERLRRMTLEPVTRDHVRIDERGVALLDGPQGMKFDRAVLPAGHRFTFELKLRSNHAEEPDWKRILDLLLHPCFRIGGATRRGLGRLTVVRVHVRTYDLASTDERRAYLSLPRHLGAVDGLKKLDPADCWATSSRCWEKIEIEWRPTQEWRVGGAARATQTGADDVDMRPLREEVVSWSKDGQTPTLKERWVLPASGLKGALAHRVVYHANRRERRWAGRADSQGTPYTSSDCPVIDRLFGYVRRSKDHTVVTLAHAGSVLFDDRLVEDRFIEGGSAGGATGRAQHVSGDRFTGGVIHGALFDEEFVRPGVAGGSSSPWTFECWVRKDLDTTAQLAFTCALEDWVRGRLNVGAAGSRSYGYGRGTLRLPAAWQGRKTVT